jgi:hypothetical protein
MSASKSARLCASSALMRCTARRSRVITASFCGGSAADLRMPFLRQDAFAVPSRRLAIRPLKSSSSPRFNEAAARRPRMVNRRPRRSRSTWCFNEAAAHTPRIPACLTVSRARPGHPAAATGGAPRRYRLRAGYLCSRWRHDRAWRHGDPAQRGGRAGVGCARWLRGDGCVARPSAW